MKKKKLVRFSLEDWQANPKRKVVTDDGRDVRIVCVDRMDGKREVSIAALVSSGETNALCVFDMNGIQSGEQNNNGWRLCFEVTDDHDLENALLVDGFRGGGQEGDKLYYKTVNAGGENEYEVYVRLSNEVNDVSYMRIRQNGIEASARVPLKEGTTCAEIQEWAKNFDTSRL